MMIAVLQVKRPEAQREAPAQAADFGCAPGGASDDLASIAARQAKEIVLLERTIADLQQGRLMTPQGYVAACSLIRADIQAETYKAVREQYQTEVQTLRDQVSVLENQKQLLTQMLEDSTASLKQQEAALTGVAETLEIFRAYRHSSPLEAINLALYRLYTRNQQVPRYTHAEDGGTYTKVGHSTGAGESKGELVVYRSTANGRLFHRSVKDFEARIALQDAEGTPA